MGKFLNVVSVRSGSIPDWKHCSISRFFPIPCPSVSAKAHEFHTEIIRTQKMEKNNREIGYPGYRHKVLIRSFKLGLDSLLTTCSKEDFRNFFPRFSHAEQERLHQLYTKVIVAVHENIEDELDDVCKETKVGNALDIVEALVEEQTLDPLYHDKTNFKDVAQVLSTMKKNEIQNLTTMLEKTEAENQVLRSRVELLRNQIQDSSGALNALEKIKKGM